MISIRRNNATCLVIIGCCLSTTNLVSWITTIVIPFDNIYNYSINNDYRISFSYAFKIFVHVHCTYFLVWLWIHCIINCSGYWVKELSFDGNILSSLSFTVSFSPCEKEIKIPRKGPGVFVEKIEKIEIEIIKVEINIIWLIYNFDIF